MSECSNTQKQCLNFPQSMKAFPEAFLNSDKVFFNVYMCVCTCTDARKEHQSSWIWGCRQLRGTIRMLATQFGSSVRAAGVLNCWTIFPGPQLKVFFYLFAETQITGVILNWYPLHPTSSLSEYSIGSVFRTSPELGGFSLPPFPLPQSEPLGSLPWSQSPPN